MHLWQLHIVGGVFLVNGRDHNRAFDGNLATDVIVGENDSGHWIIYERWESIEHDEAYRSFRAGEGKI